jgi:hypothetical protein
LEAVKAQKPHKYARNNQVLDGLARRIGHFEHRRQTEGREQDRQYKIKSKMHILSMIETLAEGAPIPAGSDILIGEPNPVGHAIAMRLSGLQDALDKAHFEEDETKKKALTAEIGPLVDALHQTLVHAREQIQPLRPRLKPTREHYEFAAVNEGLYSPVARAFAAAGAADRQSRTGPHMFSKLKNLDYLVRETKGFCAMLDFSLEVKAILDGCKGHVAPPESYWAENREAIQRQLQQAAARFDEALKPLHLKVNAGSASYVQCMDAIGRVRKARHCHTVKDAHDALKHHAFLFVMGGEDKWRGDAKRVHKLITRIAEAYKQDRELVKQDCDAYEHQYDADTHPYEDPLEESSHTLNRVYEARWAIAAERLAEMVSSYKGAIANPDIRHEGQARPAILAMGQVPDAIESRARIQRQLANARNKTKAPMPLVDGGVINEGRAVEVHNKTR